MKSTIWGGYIQAQKSTATERIISCGAVTVWGFYSEEWANKTAMDSAISTYPVSEGWHSHKVGLIHVSDEDFQAIVKDQMKREEAGL